MLHNWLEADSFATCIQLFMIILKEHGQIFDNNVFEISQTVNLSEFAFKVQNSDWMKPNDEFTFED